MSIQGITALPTSTAVQKPLKQLAVTILTQLLSWVFAMIVTFVLPRYRTVPEFAIFSVMFGYTNFVNSIGDSGISALVSRSISVNPDRTWGLLKAAAIIKIAVSLAAAGIVALLFHFIHYDPMTAKFVVYGIICSTVNQVGAVCKDAIRGFGRVSASSILQVVERGIGTALTVTLAITNQPLHMFVWVPVLFDICMGFYSITRLKKLASGASLTTPDTRAELKFLISQFLIMSSGFVILQAKDPLSLTLMEYWGSPEAIGGFSVMKRMLGSAMFLPVAVAQLGLPLMTRAYNNSQGAFERQTRALMQSSLLIGMPLMAGFLCHSNQVLSAVGLYPKFVYGPITMMVGAPMVVLLYMAMILVNAIIACGRQKQMVAGTIKVTVSIPFISVICIYYGNLLFDNAAVGAILSDLIVEVMLICVYSTVVRAGILTRELARNIGFCFVLSIPLAFAGMLPLGAMWIVATVGALGLYAGALYKMGLLHKRMLEVGEESIR
jgi:O-antigen/teichoic acid export membrane protein